MLMMNGTPRIDYPRPPSPPLMLRHSESTSNASSNASNNGNSNGSARSSLRCYNCHQVGHVSQDCPKPKMTICYNCHREGHKTFQCMVGKRCHLCNQSDHLARDCPISPTTNNSNSGNIGISLPVPNSSPSFSSSPAGPQSFSPTHFGILATPGSTRAAMSPRGDRSNNIIANQSPGVSANGLHTLRRRPSFSVDGPQHREAGHGGFPSNRSPNQDPWSFRPDQTASRNHAPSARHFTFHSSSSTPLNSNPNPTNFSAPSPGTVRPKLSLLPAALQSFKPSDFVTMAHQSVLLNQALAAQRHRREEKFNATRNGIHLNIEQQQPLAPGFSTHPAIAQILTESGPHGPRGSPTAPTTANSEHPNTLHRLFDTFNNSSSPSPPVASPYGSMSNTSWSPAHDRQRGAVTSAPPLHVPPPPPSHFTSQQQKHNFFGSTTSIPVNPSTEIPPIHTSVSSTAPSTAPFTPPCACCVQCANGPQCSCGCMSCIIDHRELPRFSATSTSVDDRRWKGIEENPTAWLQTMDFPVSVSAGDTLFPMSTILTGDDSPPSYENFTPWKTSFISGLPNTTVDGGTGSPMMPTVAFADACTTPAPSNGSATTADLTSPSIDSTWANTPPVDSTIGHCLNVPSGAEVVTRSDSTTSTQRSPIECDQNTLANSGGIVSTQDVDNTSLAKSSGLGERSDVSETSSYAFSEDSESIDRRKHSNANNFTSDGNERRNSEAFVTSVNENSMGCDSAENAARSEAAGKMVNSEHTSHIGEPHQTPTFSNVQQPDGATTTGMIAPSSHHHHHQQRVPLSRCPFLSQVAHPSNIAALSQHPHSGTAPTSHHHTFNTYHRPLPPHHHHHHHHIPIPDRTFANFAPNGTHSTQNLAHGPPTSCGTFQPLQVAVTYHPNNPIPMPNQYVVHPSHCRPIAFNGHHHHHHLRHHHHTYPRVVNVPQGSIYQSAVASQAIPQAIAIGSSVPTASYQGPPVVKSTPPSHMASAGNDSLDDPSSHENNAPGPADANVPSAADPSSASFVHHVVVHHRHQVVHCETKQPQELQPSSQFSLSREHILERLETSVSSLLELVNETKKALHEQPDLNEAREVVKKLEAFSTGATLRHHDQGHGRETAQDSSTNFCDPETNSNIGEGSPVSVPVEVPHESETQQSTPKITANSSPLSAKLALASKHLPAYRVLPLSEHGRCGCCYICDVNTQLNHHQCGCLCAQCQCAPTEFSTRKRCCRIKNAPKCDHKSNSCTQKEGARSVSVICELKEKRIHMEGEEKYEEKKDFGGREPREASKRIVSDQSVDTVIQRTPGTETPPQEEGVPEGCSEKCCPSQWNNPCPGPGCAEEVCCFDESCTTNACPAEADVRCTAPIIVEAGRPSCCGEELVTTCCTSTTCGINEDGNQQSEEESESELEKGRQARRKSDGVGHRLSCEFVNPTPIDCCHHFRTVSCDFKTAMYADQMCYGNPINSCAAPCVVKWCGNGEPPTDVDQSTDCQQALPRGEAKAEMDDALIHE